MINKIRRLLAEDENSPRRLGKTIDIDFERHSYGILVRFEI